MRIVIGLLLALVTVLSAISCGDASNPEQPAAAYTPSIYAPSPTPADAEIPTATPEVGEAFTQDDYAEWAVEWVASLNTLTAKCGLEEINALYDKDTEVQAAMEHFKQIENRLNSLREAEGIVLPDDYNVFTHRVDHEDWLKMAHLGLEFANAGTAIFNALEKAARSSGCDI